MSVNFLIWIHIWILQFQCFSSQSLTSTFISTDQSHKDSSTVSSTLFYTAGTTIDPPSPSNDSFQTNHMTISTSEHLVSSSEDFLDSFSIRATSASEFSPVHDTENSYQSTIDAVGFYSSTASLTSDIYQSEVKSEEGTVTVIIPSSISDSIFNNLSSLQTHSSSTVIMPSKTSYNDYVRSLESALINSMSEKVQLENSDISTVSMLPSQSVISPITDNLSLESYLQTLDCSSTSSEAPDALTASLTEDISVLQSLISSKDVSNSNEVSFSVESSQTVYIQTDTLVAISSLTPTQTYAVSDTITSDMVTTNTYGFPSDTQSFQLDTSSFVLQNSDFTSVNTISDKLYSSSYMLSSKYMETTISLFPSISTNVAANSVYLSTSSEFDSVMSISDNETPMLSESQIIATESETVESSYFSKQSESSNLFDSELSDMFSVNIDSSKRIVSTSIQQSNIFSGTVPSSDILDKTKTSIIDISQSEFSPTVDSETNQYSSTENDSDMTDINISVTASYSSYDGSSGSVSETTVPLITTETFDLSDQIASSNYQQSNMFSATIRSTDVFDKTNSPTFEIPNSDGVSHLTSEMDMYSSTESVLATSDVYESITTSFNSYLNSSGSDGETSVQPMTTETSVLYKVTQLESPFSPLSSDYTSDLFIVTLPYSISPTYVNSILPTLPLLPYSISTEISSSSSVDSSTIRSSVAMSDLSVISDSTPSQFTSISTIGTSPSVSWLSDYTLSDEVLVLPSLSSEFIFTEEAAASVSLSAYSSTKIIQSSAFKYETMSDVHSLNSSDMFYQTVSVTSKTDQLSKFPLSTDQSSLVLESLTPSVSISTSYSNITEAYSGSVVFNTTEESGIISTISLTSDGIGPTITSVTYQPESSFTRSMFSEMDTKPFTSSLSTADSSDTFDSTNSFEISSHIIVTEPLSLYSFLDITTVSESLDSPRTSLMSEIVPLPTSTSLTSKFDTITLTTGMFPTVSEDDYISSKSLIYTSTTELSEILYSTSISEGSLPSSLFTQSLDSIDLSMSLISISSDESLNIKTSTSISLHGSLTSTIALSTDFPSDNALTLTRTPQLTSKIVSTPSIENSSLSPRLTSTLSSDSVFLPIVTSEIYPSSSTENSNKFSSSSSHELQTSMEAHSSLGPSFELSSMTFDDISTLAFSNVDMSTNPALYSTRYLSSVSTLSKRSDVDDLSIIQSLFSSFSMNTEMLSSYPITIQPNDTATTSHVSSELLTATTSTLATATTTTSGMAFDLSTIPFNTSVDASSTRSGLSVLPTETVSGLSSTFTTIFDTSIIPSTTMSITNVIFATSISNISVTSLTISTDMSINPSTSLATFPEMSINASTPITEISVTSSTTTSRPPDTTTEPPSQTTPNITASEETFWVKTVLVARKTTDISGLTFRTDLEARMAEAFYEAFKRERLIAQGVFEHLRRKRYATVGEASIHIHDITRVGDSTSVNVVYAVEKTGTVLTPEEAASSLNVLSTQELAIILRQIVQTVAEPYLSTSKPNDTDDGGIPLWLIATIAGAVAGVIILVWLFVCVYVKCCREKKEMEKQGEPELTGIQHASSSNETPRRNPDNGRNGRGSQSTSGGAQSGQNSKTNMMKAFTYQVNKADEEALVENVPEDNSAIETTVPTPVKVHDNNHYSPRVKSPSRHEGTGSNISLSYKHDLQPPTTSRKAGKLSTRKSVDRSYQGVDYIDNVDSRSRSHSNKYQVLQSSFSDQDNEDLRERTLMERQKNKERIRIKKRKHRPKAYDLPSNYLQQTLGMPSTTLPSVHIDSGSPVQEDVEIKPPLSKGTVVSSANPSGENSLVEARTRMHRLLDDAFSLITPHASFTDLNQRSSQDIQTLLPNEVPSASNSKIFEKTNRDLDRDSRQDEMYVNPAYNQSSFPLETWSPYRTSDLVAMISMPSKAEPTRLGQKPKSATRPLSSKPNRRPAANFDFTESKSASTFDDDRFTTNPGKPIVIRTKDTPDSSSRHSNIRVHSGRTTATVNPLPKPNQNEQFEMSSLKNSSNGYGGRNKTPGVSSKHENATKDYNPKSDTLIKDLRDELSELKDMYNVSNTNVQRKKNRKQPASSLTEIV